MKVKVCGITRYEDAAAALDCGADALGFNFYERSPRYIEPADARAIIRRLPPLVTAVGVFVNADEPSGAARAAGIGVLQLHGDETPAYCRRLADHVLIKALRIGVGMDVPDLETYPVQAFLLDSKDDVLFGGTGKTFDWAARPALRDARPIILAGGLNPSNVADAIRALLPYAVDVCSGVESAPGRKDAGKLRAFIEEVRNVADEIRETIDRTR